MRRGNLPIQRENEAQTSSDQVPIVRARLLLDATERDIVAMLRSSQGAADVIRAVTQIEHLIDESRANGYDARAEMSRASALHERLVGNAERVVKLAQSGGDSASIADTKLWQEIQAEQSKRQANRRRNWIIVTVGLLMMGLLLFVVIPAVFPPVPQADTFAIAQLAATDEAGALALAQSEQVRVPTDPASLLWIGAIEQRRGNTAAAEAAFTDAQTRYNNDLSFHADRSTVFMQLGQLEGAEADGQALLELEGGAALGHYVLGGVREAQNRVPEALAEFQKASDLAEQAGQSDLVVAARSRQATLLQRSP